jgi:hypothetical protein
MHKLQPHQHQHHPTTTQTTNPKRIVRMIGGPHTSFTKNDIHTNIECRKCCLYRSIDVSIDTVLQDPHTHIMQTSDRHRQLNVYAYGSSPAIHFFPSSAVVHLSHRFLFVFDLNVVGLVHDDLAHCGSFFDGIHALRDANE